jgi:hypothetical protein
MSFRASEPKNRTISNCSSGSVQERELWLIRRSTFRERPRDPMVFFRGSVIGGYGILKIPLAPAYYWGKGALKTTNG